MTGRVLQKSKTITVSISRPAAEVYHFASNPENFPDWARFCESIERQEGDWMITTPDGRMKIRFVESNPYGLLDHYVTVAPGQEIHVPMRVVPNAAGAEVIFTLFQTPGMSDARFAEDAATVERDLQTLRRLLEG